MRSISVDHSLALCVVHVCELCPLCC